MIELTVTKEQAQALLNAVKAKEEASERAALVLNVLTAGHIGGGFTLANIDVATGVLSFLGSHDNEQ